MKGLHVHGITHAFDGQQVLNNVSFVVPAGELVCLLGPSGCGKTTLLRIAAGLERLQHGTILIDDEVMAGTDTHVAPEDRRVGLMFQDYALFPHLTVRDNVTFGLMGLGSTAADDRAMELLAHVGMAGHAAKHPHMLSGGQQQRVALVRALAPEPRLLLLDEPFSGLDTGLRARIREDTLNVLDRSGVATLMVTHDPEEAMIMADRIKVLGAGGQVLQSGRPTDIYHNPVDGFVAELFGPVNRIHGVVSHGGVDSPLGRITVNDIADGRSVEVLIRPEGVLLGTEGTVEGGVPVEVISTRLLGNSNHIRLRTAGADSTEFQALAYEQFDPLVAGPIVARIDAEHTFVYLQE